MSNKKVAVIIPAYNEEKTIGKVLTGIKNPSKKEIIVVDNNSSDKTAEIAKSLKVKVVKNPIRTYDAQCSKGIASIKNSKIEVLVFLHAGGDDDPKDIEKLVRPVLNKKADLVMGNRIISSQKKDSLLWHQLIGTKLIINLINLRFSKKFSDNGPFRAISFKAYQDLNMQPKGFSWTSQMLIKALAKKLKVLEIPIKSQKRQGRSKISGSVTKSFFAMKDMLWSLQFMFRVPT